jgi:death-on-curing protein
MTLSIEEVMEIHAELLAGDGGAPSAAGSRTSRVGVDASPHGCCKDPIEEAAALWESLSQNRPFIDGNKRTSFAVMDIHLRAHGFVLVADSSAVY